jgi:RNA 2',3'-cyclic 3'-phosphodiesterase
MNRLFVALLIPDDIKEEIVKLRKEIDDTPINWQNEDKLHITLKFIGDVADNTQEDIKEKLNFISDYKSINAKLNGFNFFYRSKDPVVLWMGIDADVSELAGAADKAISEFGIPEEKRKFTPHLTLLRIKRKIGNDFVKKFTDFRVPEIKFNITEAVLYKSTLTAKSSSYEQLKNYKLI